MQMMTSWSGMSSFQRACALLVVCTACSLPPGSARLHATPVTLPPGPPNEVVPVAVVAESLAVPAQCSDSFVTHTLDHVTLAHSDVPHLFESNGAGLAINDLNGDGFLDVVLANLNGPASILWNEGNF